MRKILLTSAGFENERIMKIFHSFFDREPAGLKALFIPTAANNADAIAVLPKCMDDLLNARIQKNNITVFDLHRNMNYEELGRYDVVYFTGGSPHYLLERINATGFNKPLHEFVEGGGVYIGVSAGSWVAANNLPDSLGFINCTIEVHAETGTKNGVIDVSANPHIKLTDDSAILILGDEYAVVG